MKNIKYYKSNDGLFYGIANKEILKMLNLETEQVKVENKGTHKSVLKIYQASKLKSDARLVFLLDSFCEPTNNIEGGNRYNRNRFLKAIKNLKGFDTSRKFYYCFNPVEYKNYNSWFTEENINSKLLTDYVLAHQQLYEGKNKEQIKKDNLFYESDPKDIKPLIYYDYNNDIYPIATNEDLTVIGADVGIGKSKLIQLMVTGLLREKINSDADIDTLEMKFNKPKGVIVHFDTEMSHKSIYNRVKFHTVKRLGSTSSEIMKHYTFKMLKRFGAEERILEIDDTLKAINAVYGGVGAVFIDGLGDLTLDKNSSEGATLLQQYLDKWSIIYNCPVVGTMHYNPSRKNFGSDEKLSGHLGTKLFSKAETSIGITPTNEKNKILLQFKKTRDANPTEAPKVHYKYNEVGIPEFIEYDNTIKQTPAEIIFQATMDVLTANAGSPINQTKLLKGISEITDYSIETLRKNYIDTIRKYPKVTHTKRGNSEQYILENSEGVQAQIPT